MTLETLISQVEFSQRVVVYEGERTILADLRSKYLPIKPETFIDLGYEDLLDMNVTLVDVDEFRSNGAINIHVD